MEIVSVVRQWIVSTIWTWGASWTSESFLFWNRGKCSLFWKKTWFTRMLIAFKVSCRTSCTHLNYYADFIREKMLTFLVQKALHSFFWAKIYITLPIMLGFLGLFWVQAQRPALEIGSFTITCYFICKLHFKFKLRKCIKGLYA